MLGFYNLAQTIVSMKNKFFLILISILFASLNLNATNYYINAEIGKDGYKGTNMKQAFHNKKENNMKLKLRTEIEEYTYESEEEREYHKKEMESIGRYKRPFKIKKK